MKGGIELNERIKTLRKELKMTQDAFASKIGLSRNFIAQIEIGTKVPSARTISDICREFDVNENWLKDGTGEMFIEKTKSEQIWEMLSDVTKEDDESFKHRLIAALSNLDESGWIVLENLINDIQKKG
jgi:transcriptional regulator with XRE-family HTH domain